MSKQRTLGILAALAALPLVANAQPATGDWELTLGGGGGIPNSNANNANVNLNGSLGYFFTDQWEGSLRQGLAWANAGDTLNGNTDIAFDYHFHNGSSPLVPFIGALVGITWRDNASDDWDAGPEAGVKYYIREKAFIQAVAQYRFPIRDGALDNGNWNFIFGIGLNL